MYKASFDTHPVTVLIAVLMTLLLSHNVLALFCFGTLCVESKGLERLGSSSLVRGGAEDPLGYCCLLCCSLSLVALGMGTVGQDVFGGEQTSLDLLALLLSLSGGSWNGKGRSGGFGGGRTSLDSDPNRQADFSFAISAWHLAKNSFIAALLSSRMLSFVTCLSFLVQLSKQSPLM